ncbi:MAG: GNAT family N-acetyltransferase [Steroidobacteraceae bacterium]|nr:GNAT family N-acetyltransferase [Steroidobacteraceae bacterium]
MRLHTEIASHLAAVPSADWDALDGAGNPFLSHAFLEALESCGCVGGDSGWQPSHLLLRDDDGCLQGAVPRYAKAHSWGEFVFDWNWAQSYARAGLAYYPKSLAAVPYTPVTGPRLLVRPGPAADAHRLELAAALRDAAERDGHSGSHANFNVDADQQALEAAGFLRRQDVRFLWRNRGYRDFDDYLDGFRADKRKKVRRERRRVAESGIVVRTLAGESIARELWEAIFAFSERTFLLHGNAHYLNAEFLAEVACRRPGSVVVKLAERDGVPLAAAIFFQDGGMLYGRYWGSATHEDCLHFEACYYQGIEHCIEHGLDAFDPGTQGEHKLARGFEPTLTQSAHWLAHEGFRSAVARYLERERAAVADYVAAAAQHLPFQRGPSP